MNTANSLACKPVTDKLETLSLPQNILKKSRLILKMKRPFFIKKNYCTMVFGPNNLSQVNIASDGLITFVLCQGGVYPSFSIWYRVNQTWCIPWQHANAGLQPFHIMQGKSFKC